VSEPDPWTQSGTEPGAEPEDRPRRDPWRAVRKTVAQTVVVFTIPFVFAIVQAAFKVGRLKVDRSPAAWTVWGLGVALMIAASALAIQQLRGKAPAVTGARTAWVAGGGWVAGLVLIIVYAQMVPLPHA
jgi:hypothetical protein